MIQAFRNFMTRRTISAKARNKVMNSFSNYKIFSDIRVNSETLRQKEQRPHEVLYFHKVDDPYSHLTVQCIAKFQSSFDIILKPILVGEENLDAIHEPSLYNIYCLRDVQRIAPFYGVNFNAQEYPEKKLIDKANSILSSVKEEDFAKIASSVSAALWEDDADALDELSSSFFSTKKQVREKLIQGNEIRDAKGYYFGSAFYYEKELYWGVDRLPHLEERLSDLGAKKSKECQKICPLELQAPDQLTSDTKINLYYYPSLNSPYTFVSTKRVRQIREDYPCLLYTSPSPRDS